MQKKLLLTYIVLIVLTVVSVVGLSWSRIDAYFYDRVEIETMGQTAILKNLLEETSVERDEFQSFVNEYAKLTEVRITLVEMDGSVFVDSDNDAIDMDNHANRPEVLGAIKGTKASSIRYSNTMKIHFFYYATLVESRAFTGILRVAVPIDEIQSITNEMILIIFLGAGLGSIVAFLVAYLVTNRLMKPINELTRVAKVISDGNYDEKIYLNQNDQIGELAETFNMMTFTLRKNIWDLAQKNAELESILTSMNSGLAAINKDYRIALYNDTFVKMLDLPHEDLQDKLFYEVIRELSVFEIIEKSIEEQEPLVDETMIHVDGEDKVIKIVATPIFEKNKRGKSLGTLIVITDVTQIRKLENMRRDFVSNVTHELKTPLTSIRGFVDTLKNGAIDEPDVALRFLDIIDIEADRLTSLIQDILSLSEIETMVGDKNIDMYAMGDILEEVVDIIPKDKPDVDILIDIEEELPLFECNKNRIKQLMINLVDNSMKYTDHGHVKVQCYEEFRYLNIVVEDTGIGIEHKHLSRLFERFYRVDKGRSRKMGGTGLGLSIVKHIVELYHGEINIESEVDKGTTITIRLPY